MTGDQATSADHAVAASGAASGIDGPFDGFRSAVDQPTALKPQDTYEPWNESVVGGTVPSRRRRAFLTAALVLVATGVGAAAGSAFLGKGYGGGEPQATPVAAAAEPATAEVVSKTLRNRDTVTAKSSYASAGPLVTGRPGTLTWSAKPGAVLGRGSVAFRVDDEPVITLLGPIPVYRDMRLGDEGRDVRQLQLNLRALGYGGLSSDGKYTKETAAAVKRWLSSFGVKTDGAAVPRGQVIFLDGRRRVGSRSVAFGRTVVQETEVLQLTRLVPRLTANVDPTFALAVKKSSTVRLLVDGKKVGTGGIVSVRKKPAPSSGYTLVVQPAAQVRASVTGSNVAVEVTTSEARNVLVVPIAALLSVTGGYAVEVYENNRLTTVPVEVGLFTDTEVEVRSDRLADGTRVKVPQL